MRVKSISIEEFEHIVHNSAVKFLEYKEPIPDFDTRYPNRLESCLLTPFMGFGGEHHYKGLNTKASIMFYLLIKNHPFKNGNKRMALVALLYFLYKNKKWMKISPNDIYEFTKWVAISDNKLKDETVVAISKYIRINMVKLISGKHE